MDVNTLRSRVLELSHDEDAPDTQLKAKALTWLNSAYHELMDLCLPYLGRYLTQTVRLTTDANGVAALGTGVYRVLRVVDVTHKRTLIEQQKLDLMEVNPVLSDVGEPRFFWLERASVHVYPSAGASVDLDVVYLPAVTDLVDGGAESSVMLPVPFHGALVWGALVWGAVYERGFSAQSDLVLFQQKWDEAKRNIKLSLAAQTVRRVEGFELV